MYSSPEEYNQTQDRVILIYLRCKAREIIAFLYGLCQDERFWEKGDLPKGISALKKAIETETDFKSFCNSLVTILENKNGFRIPFVDNKHSTTLYKILHKYKLTVLSDNPLLLKNIVYFNQLLRDLIISFKEVKPTLKSSSENKSSPLLMENDPQASLIDLCKANKPEIVESLLLDDRLSFNFIAAIDIALLIPINNSKLTQILLNRIKKIETEQLKIWFQIALNERNTDGIKELFQYIQHYQLRDEDFYIIGDLQPELIEKEYGLKIIEHLKITSFDQYETHDWWMDILLEILLHCDIPRQECYEIFNLAQKKSPVHRLGEKFLESEKIFPVIPQDLVELLCRLNLEHLIGKIAEDSRLNWQLFNLEQFCNAIFSEIRQYTLNKLFTKKTRPILANNALIAAAKYAKDELACYLFSKINKDITGEDVFNLAFQLACETGKWRFFTELRESANINIFPGFKAALENGHDRIAAYLIDTETCHKDLLNEFTFSLKTLKSFLPAVMSWNKGHEVVVIVFEKMKKEDIPRDLVKELIDLAIEHNKPEILEFLIPHYPHQDFIANHDGWIETACEKGSRLDIIKNLLKGKGVPIDNLKPSVITAIEDARAKETDENKVTGYNEILQNHVAIPIQLLLKYRISRSNNTQLPDRDEDEKIIYFT